MCSKITKYPVVWILLGSSEISKEINNKDWKGVLTFDKIWNGLQDDYRQDNINIEFDIKYVLED